MYRYNTPTTRLSRALLELDPDIPQDLLSSILMHPKKRVNTIYALNKIGGALSTSQDARECLAAINRNDNQEALFVAFALLGVFDFPTELARHYVQDILGLKPWQKVVGNTPQINFCLNKARRILQQIKILHDEAQDECLMAIKSLIHFLENCASRGIDLTYIEVFNYVERVLAHPKLFELSEAIEYIDAFKTGLSTTDKIKIIYLNAILSDAATPEETAKLLMVRLVAGGDVSVAMAHQQVQVVLAYPKKQLLALYINHLPSSSAILEQGMLALSKMDRVTYNYLETYLQLYRKPHTSTVFLLVTSLLQGYVDILSRAPRFAQSIQTCARHSIDTSFKDEALESALFTATIDSIGSYSKSSENLFSWNQRVQSLSASEGYRSYCSAILKCSMRLPPAAVQPTTLEEPIEGARRDLEPS